MIVARKVWINCAPMNIGNHLLAYLHAEYLKSLTTRQVSLSFDPIPELGLLSTNHSILTHTFKGTERLNSGIYLRARNRFLWPRIMISLSKLAPTKIQINHPMMSIKRLPPLSKARILVPGTYYYIDQALRFVGKYIHSHLFVNIRAGDILQPIHRNYSPLSINQITEAQLSSKKPLLFFGQTGSSSYMDLIKVSFPDSIFIYTNCPYTDFEINRISEQTLIPISTFSWISTWLSTSSKQIYYPCAGLYSRNERPDVYLIPQNDVRYVQLKT